MPPFVPRRQLQGTPSKKPTLFDDLDRKSNRRHTLQDNRTFLDQLGDTSSDSSLSDLDSSEFEDVETAAPPKRRKVDENGGHENVDWEDVTPTALASSTSEPSGDLELTLDQSVGVSLTNPHGTKKGPSKIERALRIQIHCMHVQLLVFHSLLRNGWACDRQVQQMLVEHLPPKIKKEVERWKTRSGMDVDVPGSVSTSQGFAKKARSERNGQPRAERNWGGQAEKLEAGAPDLSRGDPLIRLLRILSAYWRKRFSITSLGLRKQGYRPLSVLDAEISSFRDDPHDPQHHGERIKDLEEFREHATRCEGSRDVGAQLFTALLRGLGLSVRMVSSIQPIGFGWSEREEASTHKKKRMSNQSAVNREKMLQIDDEEIDNTSSDESMAKNQKRADGSSQLDEDGISLIEVTPSLPRSLHFDKDLAFPHYWCEVLSPLSNRYIPVESLVLNVVASTPEVLTSFEPRGSKADKSKQVIAYVVGFSADGTAKDITVRYLKRHMWPGKTKGVRMPGDWFKRVMNGYARDEESRTLADDIEDQQELQVFRPNKDVKAKEETLQWYKQSSEFILERFLRRDTCLGPESKPVKIFTTGKGDKAVEEKVFLRQDVLTCKTVEAWNRFGRQVKLGEQPMKMVPVRAVTRNRREEVKQALAQTGQQLKQALYAEVQTEWLIPPPIKDGVIPLNSYNRMDCFVPSMVPRGAVHLPLRGVVSICKRLNVSHAEAVVGFEFKSQRAVPLVSGVVVAAENEQMVMDAWRVVEAERIRKAEGKRTQIAIALWRKFLMGLRVYERVHEEYGENKKNKDEINPFTNRSKNKRTKREAVETNATLNGQGSENVELLHDVVADGETGGGGFIIEDDEASLTETKKRPRETKHALESSATVSISSSAGSASDSGSSTSASMSRRPSHATRRRGPPRKVARTREVTIRSRFFEQNSDGDKDGDGDATRLGVMPRQSKRRPGQKKGDLR